VLHAPNLSSELTKMDGQNLPLSDSEVAARAALEQDNFRLREVLKGVAQCEVCPFHRRAAQRALRAK